MGAASFTERAKRSEFATRDDAFRELTARSRHEHGHSYSGEIGMKHEVRGAPGLPAATWADAEARADAMIDTPAVDKWGPAMCIEVLGPDGGWLFFGRAAC